MFSQATFLQRKFDAMTVKAGTGIIIRRGNKVLVGERQGSHGAGCLAFPGGHLDDDDNYANVNIFQ